jgi:hypothetical protein
MTPAFSKLDLSSDGFLQQCCVGQRSAWLVKKTNSFAESGDWGVMARQMEHTVKSKYELSQKTISAAQMRWLSFPHAIQIPLIARFRGIHSNQRNRNPNRQEACTLRL